MTDQNLILKSVNSVFFFYFQFRELYSLKQAMEVDINR